MTARKQIQCRAHGARPWSVMCVHLAKPIAQLDRATGFDVQELDNGAIARPPALCASCAKKLAVTVDDMVAVCVDCWDRVAKFFGVDGADYT